MSMQAQALSHYRPSGRLPLKALLLAGLFSLVAVPAGWLYAWLTFHIPFVYLNFFITLGFAIVLACAASFAGEQGKARNKLLMGLVGLAIGLFGWYCQWSAWASMVGGDAAPGMFDIARAPQALFAFAGNVYEEGVWTLKGATVNGFFLGLVWFIELIILAGIPALMGLSQAESPFCEATNSWAVKEELPARLAFIPDAKAVEAARDAQPDALLALLPEWDAQAPMFATLTLHACGDGKTVYMTVKNTTVTTKDGKDSTTDSTVITNLSISQGNAAALRRAFGTEKIVVRDPRDFPDTNPGK